MKLFFKFLKILCVNFMASFVPVLWISAIFGFPAVFISSIVVTLIFRKELS